MRAAGRRPLDAAIVYARRGWPVFPVHAPVRRKGDGLRCSCGHPDCGSVGKHPCTPDGLAAATTNEVKIRGYWDRWPVAGVAVRTGQASGLVVLDIDPRHGGDEALDRLQAEHGHLPPGREVRTGSGGTHLYFAHPGGDHLPNSAGRLGPGIDTRADGGYVIAPPSRHLSGGTYRVAGRGGELPDLPTWVLQALEPPPRRAPGTAARPAATGAWAKAAVDGELGRLGGAREGTRNDTLNKVAFRLGQIVGSGALREGDVEPLLIEHGIALGLREREVVRTVHSGLRAGEGSPRGLTESARDVLTSARPRSTDVRHPQLSGPGAARTAPGLAEPP